LNNEKYKAVFIMQKTFSIVSLFLCLTLTSCTTLRKTFSSSGPINIQLYPSKKIPLMDTDFLPEVSLSKTWKAVFLSDGNEIFRNIFLTADKNSISITLQDEHNKKVGSAKYSEGNTEIYGWTATPLMTAQDSIALFQWAFYSIEKVAQIFQSINLQFAIETSADGSVETRRVYNKRKCIIEIVKDGKTIRYTNSEKKITLTLQEL